MGRISYPELRYVAACILVLVPPAGRLTTPAVKASLCAQAREGGQ